MESLKENVLKYCPFCGSKLFLGQQPVKFCATCGEKLIEDKIPQQPVMPTNDVCNVDMEAVETIEDVVKCYEKFVSDKRLEGWPEEKIHLQAAELAKSLKQKIRIKLKKFSHDDVVVKTNKQSLGEADYYSMILKDCPIKENLARRLEHLMLRGYFAIRMAIDKVPSVIVYKSNLDNAIQIIRAFRKEQAAVTVIGGDFTIKVDVEKLFASFITTKPAIKTLIQVSPANLWLGDKILRADTAEHTEYGNGAMVITDQAVYFLYNHIKDKTFSWKVIPYYRVNEITMNKDKQPVKLEISYTDIDTKEIFSMASDEELSQVYAEMQRSIKAEQYHVSIKRKCLSCGQTAIEEVGAAYDAACCAKCGQKLERKLVKSRI